MWSFAQWGFDLIDQFIPPLSGSHKFFIIAIEYLIKWVEIVMLVSMIGPKIMSFLETHIICWLVSLLESFLTMVLVSRINIWREYATLIRSSTYFAHFIFFKIMIKLKPPTRWLSWSSKKLSKIIIKISMSLSRTLYGYILLAFRCP